MIKSVTIENFQTHKKTIINFSEGVNIIRGETRSGKTSIFRALRWVLRNSIPGTAFKSRFASAKDFVSVSVKLDDETTITRKRNVDSLNEYILEKPENEKVVFKAFANTVPEEIADILNISDINIQSQFDSLFFIQDSPGKIATALNKIIGQEKIDQSFGRNDSYLRSKRSELQNNRNLLDAKRKEIEEIEKQNPEKTILLINKLEENSNIIEVEKVKIEKLSVIKNKIESIKKLISSIKLIPIEKILNAQKLLEDIESGKTKIEKLQRLRKSYNSLKSDAEKTKCRIDISKIESAKKLITDIERINANIKTLNLFSSNFKKANSSISNSKTTIDEKTISLWWSKGVNDDLVWRTSQSGGRATQRAKSKKTTTGHYGDLTFTHTDIKPLFDIFIFELKRGYTDELDILCFIDYDRKQPLLLQFYDKSQVDCKLAGRVFSLIIFKRNNKKISIMIHQTTYNKMIELNGKINCNMIKIVKKNSLGFVILSFEDFFNWVKPENIIEYHESFNSFKK